MSDELKRYVGFVFITNNDKQIRVYFDSEEEKDLMDTDEGFFSCERVREKDGKTVFTLVNKNIIRYLEYEEMK